MSEPDYGALSRVVAVMNGKGGVLKTSLVANVGGWLAASGMRILLVDLDVQGNLKFDLGLVGSDQDDAGKSIVDAVWTGDPLKVIPAVRPNLDFVFGGRALEMLTSLTYSSLADGFTGGGVPAAFAHRLSQVAADYDLVLLDCPPGSGEVQDMALRASRWVLVPTKTDDGSLDGLRAVGPRVAKARRENPALDWLGVVVTAHNTSAKRILRDTLDTLAEVADKLPPFDTVIRHSEATARDCRSRGQLAHELAATWKESGAGERFKALAARERMQRSDNVIYLEVPAALSETSGPLAADYAKLANEMCNRITAAETATSAAGKDAR